MSEGSGGWVSKSREFIRAFQEAEKKALKAAAYVVRNRVMLGLRGGYTTGDFITGRVMNSVRISEPFWDHSAWAIRIGTDLDYALYWELGHHNIFTRKFERVEIWKPAFVDTKEAQARVFAAVMKRELGREMGL